jgi:hypothetical protein
MKRGILVDKDIAKSADGSFNSADIILSKKKT